MKINHLYITDRRLSLNYLMPGSDNSRELDKGTMFLLLEKGKQLAVLVT